MLDLDENGSTFLDLALSNPDYGVRATAQRLRWKEAVRSVRRSTARFAIIAASAYSYTPAGPELVLPLDLYRSLTSSLKRNGGTLEIVCLIDDVFISHDDGLDIGRRLIGRQLEWSFSQYLSTQTASVLPEVHCYALQHPLQNLTNVVFRRDAASVYLCYPINFFRRNPHHPLRVELDDFRRFVSGTGMTVYDPLGIDEEALISPDLGVRDTHSLLIRPSDRWRVPYEPPMFDAQPELAPDAEGIAVSPRPSGLVARAAKAQVPQRDFQWIAAADAVISWRPFLSGTHHAGVIAELQFALHKDKPILAYSPVADGGEHPSPFAAMISTVEAHDMFKSRILDIAAQPTHRRATTVESPPKYCDHTSVGVLIYDHEGCLLLIERGTFPFGMAAPAGHVDDHSSYEEAAIAEVREEVGLEATDLRLVAEGRRENPCRRVHGTWHYWKIFEAKVTGQIALSEREAKRFEWCDRDRLVELGLLEPNSEAAGIEGVWLDWLNDLKVLPEP